MISVELCAERENSMQNLCVYRKCLVPRPSSYTAFFTAVVKVCVKKNCVGRPGSRLIFSDDAYGHINDSMCLSFNCVLTY